jgi:hypothetical protein
MGEMTREELADQELLAYEREHHGDPYMTLRTRKRCSGWPCNSGIWAPPRRRRTERPRRKRGVAFMTRPVLQCAHDQQPAWWLTMPPVELAATILPLFSQNAKSHVWEGGALKAIASESSDVTDFPSLW